MEAGGYRDPKWWSPAAFAWLLEDRVEHPAFWVRRGEGWAWRGMFHEVPLPPAWPVYVSQAEAAAHARWRGKRLPTEAEFHRAAFDHRAAWNAAASRVEMHLVSRRRQRVVVRGLDLRLALAPGDAIWTESSYKYRPAEVANVVAPAGFRQREQWVDRTDLFALTLFEAS